MAVKTFGTFVHPDNKDLERIAYTAEEAVAFRFRGWTEKAEPKKAEQPAKPADEAKKS